MKNPPDSIFSLLHTVFIDPIIINFSSIHSNGDFLVLETHYIFKTHQITACVLTTGCRPITHSLILFESVNVSWRNCCRQTKLIVCFSEIFCLGQLVLFPLALKVTEKCAALYG